jgi:phage gp29-like protein
LDKPITDEIAGTEKDIFADYIGRIAAGDYSGRTSEPFEELMRDPQVRACMQSRRLSVIGKEWEVIPASEKRPDLKIAEFVKEALLSFDFDSARSSLLSAIVTGFKPAEIMWEYSEGSVWIRDIIGRSARRFIFGKDGSLRLLTFKNMIDGEELPERKFQVFTYGSENGSPYGYGLGPTLYWPVWFKKNAIKFWMIFAEKFGSPTAVGKYPPGTTKEQQDALLSALDALQQESAIKIPENMQVELLEAQRGGTVNTYESLLSFMNAEIAKAILGQTLTTEVGDAGSYAASKTHNDVRAEYIKADADLLSNQLNAQLIRWLVDYNFPPAVIASGAKQSRYPKLWIRTEDEADLKPLAERDEILSRIGVLIPKKYFYSTYGIPEPQEGEEEL